MILECSFTKDSQNFLKLFLASLILVTGEFDVIVMFIAAIVCPLNPWSYDNNIGHSEQINRH
jgi:hypothetical protein